MYSSTRTLTISTFVSVSGVEKRTCGGEGASAERRGLASPGSVQPGCRACRVQGAGGETERAEAESVSVLPARALHQALALRIIRSRQRRSGPVVDMDADAEGHAIALHVACAIAVASDGMNVGAVADDMDADADSTANLSAEAVRAGDVGELLGVRPDAAVFTKSVQDEADAGRSIGCLQRQRARSLTAQLAMAPLLLLLLLLLMLVMVALVALVAVVVVVALVIVAVVSEFGLDATVGVDNWPLLFLMLSVLL